MCELADCGRQTISSWQLWHDQIRCIEVVSEGDPQFHWLDALRRNCAQILFKTHGRAFAAFFVRVSWTSLDPIREAYRQPKAERQHCSGRLTQRSICWCNLRKERKHTVQTPYSFHRWTPSASRVRISSHHNTPVNSPSVIQPYSLHEYSDTSANEDNSFRNHIR